MDLDIRQMQEMCFLKIKGALKYGADVDAFNKAIDQALNAGSAKLMLDLSAAPMIDSCGIGAVVEALHRARDAGGDLRLVAPSPFAQRTFKMVGILALFQIFPSEQEATESYTA